VTAVLASGSPARQRLLRDAGVAFVVDTEPVDEAAVRAAERAAGAGVEAAALALAAAKALPVSRRHPGAVVIGADQMLEHRGRWLEKPGSRGGARRQLEALRGDRHRLVSAVALARDGAVVWSHVAVADMTVRPFSDEFLAGYLDQAGDAILGSVGAYHFEGLGAQLFARVDGDFHTVLGLPLLPLLAALRDHGVLAS